MSAPTPPARSRLTPPRLLGAAAFAGVGFVAVWRGFGVVGCGTDAHALRVVAALAPLFACGLLFVWPRVKLLGRTAAVPLGLASASAAWLFVPCWAGGMSLHDALTRQYQLRWQLSSPSLEEMESGPALRTRVDELRTQYFELAGRETRDMRAWTAGIVRLSAERFDQIPADDPSAARDFKERVTRLAIQFPEIRSELDVITGNWEAEAVARRREELLQLMPGDWAAFDRTAHDRGMLAGVFPETRDALLRAEAEWVDASVESAVSDRLTPKGGALPTRDVWKHIHVAVLALKSLDESDGRFAKARGRLFKAAHDTATAAALAHFEAGRYDRAFGVARAHAVEWSATAAALGGTEQKSLAALRTTYEFFDALASKSAKPPDPVEPAPPPRAKP